MFLTLSIFGVTVEYPRGFTPLFRPVRSAEVQDCARRDKDARSSFMVRCKGGVHE